MPQHLDPMIQETEIISISEIDDMIEDAFEPVKYLQSFPSEPPKRFYRTKWRSLALQAVAFYCDACEWMKVWLLDGDYLRMNEIMAPRSGLLDIGARHCFGQLKNKNKGLIGSSKTASIVT
jgi:hypothetical protein